MAVSKKAGDAVAEYATHDEDSIDEIENKEQLSDPLAERDRTILLLIADGKTDGEIAQALSVAPKTINYHVERIKRRFGVSTRIQAVAIALRRRYID